MSNLHAGLDMYILICSCCSYCIYHLLSGAAEEILIDDQHTCIIFLPHHVLLYVCVCGVRDSSERCSIH